MLLADLRGGIFTPPPCRFSSSPVLLKLCLYEERNLATRGRPRRSMAFYCTDQSLYLRGFLCCSLKTFLLQIITCPIMNVWFSRAIYNFVRRRRSAGETHRITVLPVMLFPHIVQLVMERSVGVTTYDHADEFFPLVYFIPVF